MSSNTDDLSEKFAEINMNKIIPHYKVIYDTIHGYINLSNLQVMIIDSKPFQRLRKLKQLGSCSYIYHNAIHSRFEHSIGTSYLASKLIESIMITTEPVNIESYLANIPELQSYYNRKYDGKIHIIDDYVIELIKISALCHDLGHGPFSHVFDDFFLPTLNRTNPNDSHETRSGILLEQIIKDNETLRNMIADDEITFMKNLINPSSNHKGFIYQIVSNGLNSLDVDKFDYLERDLNMLGIISKFKSQRLVEHIRIIDNTICYPEQAIGDIIELFAERYNLHKTVYNHKGVISAQYMLTELFTYLDPIIGISESVNDMNKFCTMTDEFILTCYNTLIGPYCKLPDELFENIVKAKSIINRLDCHSLYSHVDTYTSGNKFNIKTSDFKNGDPEKIIIYTNKIGLVSGSKNNPLDNVYAYNTKDTHRKNKLEMKKIDKSRYSLLIANNYQEYITMIFYKDKDEKTIQKLRDEFRELIKKTV